MTNRATIGLGEVVVPRAARAAGRLRRMLVAAAAAASAMIACCPAHGGAVPLQNIEPADSTPNDEFGYRVDLDGTVAIIGQRFGDANGTDSGAAYLFDAITGDELVQLLPDEAAAGDEFGTSVAISGSIAIVGAPGDDITGFDSGSAYLFDVSTGAQLAKLVPDDSTPGADFGAAVAIDGSLAIIGAPARTNIPLTGSAYVFDVNTTAQIAKLEPRTDGLTGWFGEALDIHGSRAVVGRFLFDLPGGRQSLEVPIPGDTDSEDFASAVAIEGNRVLVGAPRDDESGVNSGAAYLFDATTGEVLDKFLADPGVAGVNDRLGSAVAFSGDNAIVGARWDDHPGGIFDDAGSAYWFDLNTGEQIVKIEPPDPTAHDEFGRTVALDGLRFILGAPADQNFSNSGSAYIGSLDTAPRPGDLDGDGTVDVADLLTLLASWGPCETPERCPADLDADKTVNVTDLLALLAAWSSN